MAKQKQLSFKQQMIQSAANAQVQQALANLRQQDLGQIQADFGEWQKQQNDLANVMADFDAWRAEQQPAQAAPVKTISAPTQEENYIPSLSDFATEQRRDDNLKYRQDRRNIALGKKRREDYQRQQQLENMLADPQREQKAQTEADRKALEAFKAQDNGLLGGGIKQLDSLSDYTKAIEEQENRALEEQILNSDRYVDTTLPELTDEQKALEEQIANFDEYQVNKTDPKKSKDKLAAYGWGVSKIPFLASELIANGIVDAGETLGQAGATALDDLTGHHDDHANLEKVNNYWDAKREQVEDNIQWMKGSQKESEEENPLAYGAGKLTTQAALYFLTNPLFDKVGTALGAGASNLASTLGATEKGAKVAGKVASVLGNQVGQNLQDVALDTLPRYNELKARGMSDDEINEILGKEARNNAIGNAVFGGVGEIPALTKWLKNQNVSTPQLEDADNLVKNVTRQSEQAAQNIQDISKQIPEFSDDIKLDDSELKTLLGGMEPTNAAKQIPEIENYATDILGDAKPYDVVQDINEDDLLKDSLINDALKRIGQPIDDLDKSGIMEGVTNKAALKNYENMKAAYEEYATLLLNKDATYEELEAAARKLGNARKNFGRNMKNIDPEIAKQFDNMAYGELINQPMYNRLGTTKTPQQLDDELRAVYMAEGKSPEEIEDLIAKSHESTTDYGYDTLRDPNAITQEEFEEGQRRLEELMNGTKAGDVSDSAENLPINNNKVMAEDIGINPKPQEPDSVKGEWKIEDTPENAPTGPKPPISEGEVIPPEGMKERGQSKHIRNDGTPMKMEGVSDEVAADFNKDPDMYTVLKNADTKAKAERIYTESNNPEVEFRTMLERKDPAALPLGHQLAKDYSAAGNHEAAAQIYRDMGKALTESGQFSQAAVINMMKNDPATALEYAIKELDKLNEAGAKKYGNKWKNFSLTEDEIKAFENIKPGDEDAIKALYDNIGARIGKEYPTTLMEKLLEARRVSMLFNVRTNVRNFGANPPTLAMRWMSDRVESLGQHAAHIINPEIEVTQSLVGSGLRGRKLAKEVYDSPKLQTMLERSGSKADIPSLKNGIVDNKQVFKGGFVSKWIDKITGNGIQKANQKLFGKQGVQSVPETIRNATYKLLDLGDRPFVRENFIERLGSYINAKGIKNVADIPDEAIELAWEEAMKATYKDNSWAVDMLRNAKKSLEKADNVVPGLGRTLSQSAIPFVQAPGNIAARMVDYSPVGAAKGIATIIKNAASGDVKGVEKGIEEAAKGLTGSGLILLGMKLRESGLITGTYSEDKDQRAFEKQNGFKEFAFHLKDKYFTYGWAQPFAEELMIGTLLQDAIEKSDEYDSDILNYFGYEGTAAGKAIGATREGTRAAVNSWFNESPLHGLSELLKSDYKGDTDIAQNIWNTGVDDFAGALVPASVNAVAKSMDYTQRNTYDPTNNTASFVNAQIAKIPELSKTLPAKYDTWGREMKYADNQAMATASRFVIPGEYSYDKGDVTDKEINRLFETTNDAAVFPQVAPTSVGDKKLNNKEVSEYQKDMGQRSKEIVDAFIQTDAYKNLPDSDKVEYLKKIYGTSKAITNEKFGGEISDSSQYKKYAEAYAEKGADGVIEALKANSIMASANIQSGSNAGKAIQEAVASGDMTEANKIAQTEANYNRACELAGVEDKSSGTRKAWEQGGVSGLKEYVAKQEQKAAYEAQGLDTEGKRKAWERTQTEIPSMSVSDFTKNFNAIDSDRNGSLKHDEFYNWANKTDYSQEYLQQLFDAYVGAVNNKGQKKRIVKGKDGKWTGTY